MKVILFPYLNSLFFSIVSSLLLNSTTNLHRSQAAAASDAKKTHAEAQLAQALEHAIAQSSSSSSSSSSSGGSSASAALAAAQQEANDLRNEVAALNLSLEEVRLEVTLIEEGRKEQSI